MSLSPGKGRGKQTWTKHTQLRLQGAGWRSEARGAKRGQQDPSPDLTKRATKHAMKLMLEAAPAPEGTTSDEDATMDSEVLRVTTKALRETAMEEFRHGANLTASGFEPQRHSIYVLGRPVQVR